VAALCIWLTRGGTRLCKQLFFKVIDCRRSGACPALSQSSSQNRTRAARSHIPEQPQRVANPASRSAAGLVGGLQMSHQGTRQCDSFVDHTFPLNLCKIFVHTSKLSCTCPSHPGITLPTCITHTIAILLRVYCPLRNMRRLPDSLFLYHPHYNIGDGNIL